MRQREMTHIPTPFSARVADPNYTDGADVSPLTKDVVSRVIVHPNHWPDCSRCGQSMTGCYNGLARCNRCSSARRLNG
jgi:hypothetical protein